MPLFRNNSQKPSPLSPKPSFGWREHLGINKPSPKPQPSKPPSYGLFESLGLRTMPKKEDAAPQEAKPQTPSGFLGKDGYAKDWQLREFARKAPYGYVPGTAKRMEKAMRLEWMKELMARVQETAKREGKQAYGISGEMLEKTFRRIESSDAPGGSELYNLHRTGKYTEEKELRRKVQVWRDWARGK